MSTFTADLGDRLRARLSELEDEHGRIEAALVHLAPRTPRTHRQHVPRGVNREAILAALGRNGGLRVTELREQTGIAANTLGATLHAMKRARQVTRRSNGIWRAR
jgi:predicted transcriptional regulator